MVFFCIPVLSIAHPSQYVFGGWNACRWLLNWFPWPCFAIEYPPFLSMYGRQKDKVAILCPYWFIFIFGKQSSIFLGALHNSSSISRPKLEIFRGFFMGGSHTKGMGNTSAFYTLGLLKVTVIVYFPTGNPPFEESQHGFWWSPMTQHNFQDGWLCAHIVEVSWNRGTPSHHPFLDGIFPHKNHPVWGTPIYGKPHIDGYKEFGTRNQALFPQAAQLWPT